MIRKAAWQGRFYPGDEKKLSGMIEEFMPVRQETIDVKGIVVPHAGYIYSGPVAGEVYSRVNIPDRVVIFSPNHWEGRTRAGVDPSDKWETIYGTVSLDEKLRKALLKESSLLSESAGAHQKEHAIEVQLPFLQKKKGNDFRFVPVALMGMRMESLDEISQALVKVISAQKDEILPIASTDMSHHIPEEEARKMDKLAIDRMLAMDPEGLYKTVVSNGITMCGMPAAYITLKTAMSLGASKAELIRYTTSAEASGDYARVVGYAGVVFH